MERSKKRAIIKLFDELPEGRSARNHYKFTADHAAGIHALRPYFTPAEMQKLLDISVYRIIKLELWGRKVPPFEVASDLAPDG